MPRFTFQFDRLLRQRRRQEQQRQRELAEVALELRRLQDELCGLSERVQRTQAELRRRDAGSLDDAPAEVHGRALLLMQRQGLGLMKQLSIVQRRLDESRKALAAAQRDRHAIDALRELHHQRWLAALSGRRFSEQDQLDMHLSYWDVRDG